MNELLDSIHAARGSEWAALAGTGMRILVIALLSLAILWLAHKMIRTFRLYVSRSVRSSEEVKRIETLGRVFRYIASVVVALVAGTLILGELGISVAPILGAAGVIGLAVGFGAQSLIKDYFNGFFLLLEDQIRQGDVVEVGGQGGLVEEVTLRYVRLRDYDGNVHFIPNGSIVTVINKSRGFAYAVVDVGVAYRENADEALEVMRAAGAALKADPVFGPKILQDVEIVGVENWADSAVILRCRFKVAPLEQWNVRREYLKRLKAAFDAAGIEIPFPHLTVYAGEPKTGMAPPFRLAGEARVIETERTAGRQT
ncbi:MAG: mechanosensitive ion channel family protein [Rhodocyclaceae bacterium]|jgi:small conductance mechanosensitive channel|nr:mechanosensitive ion channel family protein [Rhodocyclaceae bacterium]MCO5097215.1 mechanosensitive ion channel family protein [Rhodocyclaceae bacterium]